MMREYEISRPTRAIELLAGFGGLLAGLLLLDREPILGVLGLLGSMALVLESLVRFRAGNSTE
jgi:hypothetical protein